MASVADRRWFWGTAAVWVVTDFVTKLVAEAHLPRRFGLDVLGDVVQLRLVYNQCAAFGLCLGDYSREIFFVLALVVLVFLGNMVRATRPRDRFRLVALALICGGAVGNLIDRIRSPQGVVDFIDVWIGRFHWPTFNLADAGISCGAVALALSLWLEARTAARPVPEAAAPPSPAGAKEARPAEP